MGEGKGEPNASSEEEGDGQRSRKLMGMDLRYIILATLLTLPAIAIFHKIRINRGRDILGYHLQTAIVAEIDFQETPLSEAVQILLAKLRLADPYFENCEFRIDDDLLNSPITLRLTDVPAITCLKYTTASSMGRYTLRPNEVIIGTLHSNHRDPVETATDLVYYWVTDTWRKVKYGIPSSHPDPFR